MRSRNPLRPAAAGIVIAILAVVVLAADQLAKTAAIDALPPERVVPIFGDVLQFYLVRNPGAAFSLGEGVTWLFTIALAVVAAVIVFLAVRRVRSRLWAVVLGLLLGGVLGNLTDRLLREPGFPVGHVVDFISTPWMMPAIYNVADVFIVSMMISVALLVLFGLRLDGTRETRASRAADAQAAEAQASGAASAEASTRVRAEGDAGDGVEPSGDPGVR
ncbi:signal peptidase II Aspartic peptidase, MEROPS family A08 [Microbacterium hydrothermale]|uniref:signal peptidase II n=1 Tax=Microbacterium hydrothermale TaxID=857427 RepID=UPI002227CEE5|nr:signal peptidase II [Microbacterium hydrothermale]MCW2164226.1 signal peptidase II Aspartic peptidase, MEROPS family A08 [Microbacterium hydrothermale]